MAYISEVVKTQAVQDKENNVRPFLDIVQDVRCIELSFVQEKKNTVRPLLEILISQKYQVVDQVISDQLQKTVRRTRKDGEGNPCTPLGGKAQAAN